MPTAVCENALSFDIKFLCSAGSKSNSARVKLIYCNRKQIKPSSREKKCNIAKNNGASTGKNAPYFAPRGTVIFITYLASGAFLVGLLRVISEITRYSDGRHARARSRSESLLNGVGSFQIFLSWALTSHRIGLVHADNDNGFHSRGFASRERILLSFRRAII